MRPPHEPGPGAGRPMPGASRSGEAPPLGPHPPWRIWEGLALLGVFFAAQLAASGLTAWFLLQRAGELSSKQALYTLPPALIVSYLLGWSAVYWLVVKRYRLAFLPALGLGRHSPLQLAGPFLGGMGLQVATAIVVAIYPPPAEHQFAFDLFLQSGMAGVAFIFLVAVGVAPLFEEVLFRGVLLPALRLRVGFAPAALGVTVLFTALHGFQFGAYWPALGGIALCGWLLAWMWERNRVLWPSVAFHTGFNFTAFVPIFFLDLV